MESRLNAHKALIWRLYIQEDKSLGAVMQHIKSNFGLDLSKAQYEKKIKDWQFSKSLDEVEWRHVIRKIRKRELPAVTKPVSSENSQVVLSGRVLPRKKVERAFQRYGHQTTIEQIQFHSALMPEMYPDEHLPRTMELIESHGGPWNSAKLELLFYTMSNNLHDHSAAFDRTIANTINRAPFMKSVLSEIFH
ncbi:hypothetical protein BX600DRAFT_517992 [Xylariales sp. PMI_506]|nr:hypothetical protein BX600DRAFT_517992 [Xylariales sp. PMI_506]